MAFSALNTLLTSSPRDAERIAEAIRHGEISAATAVQTEPALIAHFLRAAAHVGSETRNPDQQRGQLALVDILLANGADPWVADHYGHDGFAYAVQLGNTQLLRRIAGTSPNPSLLRERPPVDRQAPVVFQGLNNAPLLRTLFDLGFDPKATWQSASLLHEAKNAEVVQLLLARGLDPNALTSTGLDVQRYWDKRNIAAPERAKMEAVLRDHTPQDPKQLIKEFGNACVEVGVPAAKQRLLAAGVDLASAEHEGFSLPELMAIRALQTGLKHLRVYTLGSPGSHKKWRKSVLSVARHSRVDTWNEPRKAQLRDTVELMELIDYHLTMQNKPRSPPMATGKSLKKPAPEPKDTSLDDLRQAVGLEPRLGGPSPKTDQLARWSQLLDRMVAGQLLDNGSLLAAWVLQATLGGWNNKGDWMTPVAGEPLFLHLAKQATQGPFDPAWQGKQSMARNMARPPIAELMLPLTLPDSLARQANGVGAMACLAAAARDPKHMVRWLNIQLEDHELSGKLTLSLQDPWLKHGLQGLVDSKHPSLNDIGARLSAMTHEQDLQQDTSAPQRKRSGPRL